MRKRNLHYITVEPDPVVDFTLTQEAMLAIDHEVLANRAYHWQQASRVNAQRAAYYELRVGELARQVRQMESQNRALKTALKRATKEWRAAVKELRKCRQ